MSITENMLTRVLTGMGINVVEVNNLFTMLGVELRDIRNERQAFKTSSVNVVNEFRARLDKIEAVMTEMHDALVTLRGQSKFLHQPLINGKDIDNAE